MSRVVWGRSEDDRGPQVSARDEPRDLHLGRAVAGLSRCVFQRGDRVVIARSFTHRAAGRVGCARVQGSGLASRTGRGFTRPAQPDAGGPSQRTPRAPSLHRGAGSSATSTCDRPRHPQVPAAARGPFRSPPAHASEAGQDTRSCPRKR